ncbi:hypothetical protein [Microbacterium sp.]|uniref:hypothetical protein n=1 Tax=Microbacterium sp. TaxID=51671 RepID=UPI0026275BB1|nr:hypothetical protein [Microbacterium sp.]MCV0334077.1 hypothetical protein [Microbacterium sp.]MCV0374395.1 hypothetical protein [Microbacterium sp.]MCV0389467.1 hypothetical protein [Microbacterium sp.]MCV0419001.1 hypothetical protein [Microbacterium sp.]MCV0421307.1 hypothetical protein [Microbacterium sp.]
MIVYEAVARRDGRFWFIEIPELELFTQARTLDEIDEMAREVIAISLEIPAESFGVHVGVEQ